MLRQENSLKKSKKKIMPQIKNHSNSNVKNGWCKKMDSTKNFTFKIYIPSSVKSSENSAFRLLERI